MVACARPAVPLAISSYLVINDFEYNSDQVK